MRAKLVRAAMTDRRAALALAVLASGCADAFKASPFAGSPAGPRPFATVAHGMLAGGAIGAASTYLLVRRDGWQSGSDGRTLTDGLLYGAIAGGAIGLAAGLSDVLASTDRGYVVVCDIDGGAVTGASMGLLIGLAMASKQQDATPLAVGPAIGALAGAGLGLGVGLLEAAGSRRTAPAPPAAQRSWNLAMVPLAPGDLRAAGWTLAVGGRF